MSKAVSQPQYPVRIPPILPEEIVHIAPHYRDPSRCAPMLPERLTVLGLHPQSLTVLPCARLPRDAAIHADGVPRVRPQRACKSADRREPDSAAMIRSRLPRITA